MASVGVVGISGTVRSLKREVVRVAFRRKFGNDLEVVSWVCELKRDQRL